MIRPKVTGKKVGSVEPDYDELVPDPTVWREFGVSSMTGWRWTRDADLDFPPPIKIRNRCFRSRREIEQFKNRMMREGVQRRAPSQAED
jgi:hypothetical protein